MMIPTFERTYEKVLSAKVNVPEYAGGGYVSIKHGKLVEGIQEALEDEGMKILESKYAMDATKNDLVTCFSIETDAKPRPPTNYRYCLGVISSNNRRRALTFFSGLVDRYFDHGMVFDELIAATRDSRANFELGTVVHEAVQSFAESFDLIKELHNGYASRTLTQMEIDHLLMEACRGKVRERLLWSKLGLIDITHRDIANLPDQRTSWTLFQAVAHVLKTCPPFRQMDMSLAFRKLLPTGD
jgi:hypothetical protein